MVYLKTIFTNIEELEFIKYQIEELNELIDKVILIEPSFHHNGRDKKLTGISYLNDLSDNIKKKLIYLVVPKIESIRFSEKGEVHHRHETITRGFFYKQLKLKNKDIIISTDADEILYYDVIKKLLKEFKRQWIPIKKVTFNLYQFFYKFNLYAPDHDFIAPGMYHFGSRFLEKGFYLNGYLNWRYSGDLYPEKAGVHLSWIQEEQSLVTKALNWSHSSELNLTSKQIKLKLKEDLINYKYSFRTPEINLDKIKKENLAKVLPKVLINNIDRIENRCINN